LQTLNPRFQFPDSKSFPDTDCPFQEAAYIAALKAIPGDKLPLNSNGMPMFDLSLIGVGTDGHSKAHQALFPSINGWIHHRFEPELI
jgi:6-phosphogluconolactonase/glucosamine-6-phosphate isomerase/deaminase